MKRIRNLEQLCAAAMARKAVVVPESMCFRKPIPAAWIQNIPGVRILPLFKWGMFIYKKKAQPLPGRN